ncbi:hypothetical protein Tco_1548899 [Tanacetum coccineum]|uniref:Uncharacterized protein n=1 Tax=Tanacetum coccineum TaxID=301880 RepID=A0ABQ4WI05_9ASTR
MYSIKYSPMETHVTYQFELEHKSNWALKHANFDLKTAGDHRKLQLNELSELRDQAYENSLIYKEKTKKATHSKKKIRILSKLVINCPHTDGSNFKVNCHRLKHYYGGDTPPLVIQDLQTSLRTTNSVIKFELAISVIKTSRLRGVHTHA